MPCGRLPSLYYEIDHRLESLIREAIYLEWLATERRIKELLRSIIRELELLQRDLMMWSPYESVCYDEFLTKIRVIEQRLEFVRRLL